MEFQVNDGASINNIGLNFRTITITAVNVAPTLNPITSPAPVFENSGQQTIDLGGITAGAGRQQTLTVTATSNNTALIPNPTVSYISPATTGSLTYTPVANASGTATITVTRDRERRHRQRRHDHDHPDVHRHRPAGQPAARAHRDRQPRRDPRERRPADDQPRRHYLGPRQPDGEPDDLRRQQQPEPDPQLRPGAVALSYTSPNATAVLSYTPLPFTSGTAAIIVTVMNDGGTANGGFNLISRSFIVTVTPVNQQPTLARSRTPRRSSRTPSRRKPAARSP